MNLRDVINHGSSVLQKNRIKSAKLDSEILISKVLGKKRETIFLNPEVYINKFSIDYFKSMIDERSKGKPIAYLIGKKDFWNYQFKINKNVLIPRPDTELLIEHALKLTKHKKGLRLLDIGVGSGCILLSILKEKKDFFGTGIDISKNALELCKINAFSLGLHNRVKFFKTNVDNFNYGKYDLIVSNPPYISQIDLKNLDKEVVDFEPKLSLDGGLDGLSIIKKVINKASKLIKINGKLILEIGFDQKYKIKKILSNNGFYINKVLKDYAKNDRCIISTKNNTYS
jgi:release factor glutamine methyltransferase